MTRYRIDSLHRSDRRPGLDWERQAWIPGQVIVTGEDEAERELRQHDADYGPELLFRAVPVPDVDDAAEERVETVDRYQPRALRWVRVSVRMTPGKEAQS